MTLSHDSVCFVIWVNSDNIFIDFIALAKVFKFADVEEKGFVDVETISTLAVQLLGGHLTESQKHYIQTTSDEKTEEGRMESAPS